MLWPHTRWMQSAIREQRALSECTVNLNRTNPFIRLIVLRYASVRRDRDDHSITTLPVKKKPSAKYAAGFAEESPCCDRRQADAQLAPAVVMLMADGAVALQRSVLVILYLRKAVVQYLVTCFWLWCR